MPTLKIKDALTKVDVDIRTASGKKSSVRALDPGDTVVIVESEIDGQVQVEEQKVKNAVTAYVTQKQASEAAKQKADDAASVLRHYVGVVRTDNARQGDYQKSYRIIGNKGTKTEYAVDVSESDKWSISKDFDLSNEKVRQGVIDLLGQDTFEKLFEEEKTIAIKDEVMKNNKLRMELSALLLKHLGVDGIKKYFRRDSVWVVRKGADKLQYELPEETTKKFKEVAAQAADSVKDKSQPIDS